VDNFTMQFGFISVTNGYWRRG